MAPGADPLLRVVIVHFGDPRWLFECLASLAGQTLRRFEVTVVLASPLDPEERAGLAAARPAPRIVERLDNPGYGEACNSGVRGAETPWLLFLNNDLVLSPTCLERLVAGVAERGSVVAAQPKLLERGDRKRFDYAGAAGGMIDALGYPFALGRLFDELEEDRGQYDRPRAIFWASGAALLVRTDAFRRAGGFDAGYFMYMEEIDLCWRLLRRGGCILSIPSAVAWHHGGAGLGKASYRQLYYTHRNNLVLLFKNLATRDLLLRFPLRLALEGVTVVWALSTGRWRRARAVLAALAGFLAMLPGLWSRRRRERPPWSGDPARRMMSGGSVVIGHFLLGRRVAGEFRLPPRDCGGDGGEGG